MSGSTPEPAIVISLTRDLSFRRSSDPTIHVNVTYLNGRGAGVQRFTLNDRADAEKTWLLAAPSIADSFGRATLWRKCKDDVLRGDRPSRCIPSPSSRISGAVDFPSDRSKQLATSRTPESLCSTIPETRSRTLTLSAASREEHLRQPQPAIAVVGHGQRGQLGAANAQGGLLFSWNSGGISGRSRYDKLRRPTESWMRRGAEPAKMVSKTTYGEE
ncbi:hypothetical protein DL771_002405 [Monosporascus sp. 5C6A]|nr:hypothetical protein DL771_002405 [Monosporascus sp. 5C6A]